jgi:hypothetical protein
MPSTHRGPTPAVMVADWMHARLEGKPLTSEHWFVQSNGQILNNPL